MKKEHTNSLKGSGGSLNLSLDHMQLQSMPISSKYGIGVVPPNDNIEQLFEPTTRCPTWVALEDIRKVTELLSLKKELLIICNAKIKYLKMEEGVTSTKLLKIKYNTDDRKKIMEDNQATIDLAKEALEKL